MSKKPDRTRELEAFLAALDKQFGRGTVMRLGDGTVEQIATFTTGSPMLDRILGGGIPKGRIIEIYGPESSGKTTLSLEVVAQVQKAGGVAAFVDAEHALDLRYAKNLGVAAEDLLVSQPDCGEQALDVVESMVRSGVIDVVVVDSVAALVPRAEIEGDMGDSHVGLQARLMSQALRKLVGACHKQNCSVVFINQLRSKIGVMFGSPETTTGGNALKFYATLRLDIRKIATQRNGTEATGNRVRVKVVKNKVAPPYGEAELELVFGEGINHVLETLELAERQGVVSKSGSWWSWRGDQLGQGRDQVERRLRAEPALYEALLADLTTAQGPSGSPEEVADEAAA